MRVRDAGPEHQILSNNSNHSRNNHIKHNSGWDDQIEVCKNNRKESLHRELLGRHWRAGLSISVVHLGHLEILQRYSHRHEHEEWYCGGNRTVRTEGFKVQFHTKRLDLAARMDKVLVHL